MKQLTLERRLTSGMLEHDKWEDVRDPYDFPLGNDMPGTFVAANYYIESDMDPGDWGDPDSDRVPRPEDEPLEEERI